MWLLVLLLSFVIIWLQYGLCSLVGRSPLLTSRLPRCFSFLPR